MGDGMGMLLKTKYCLIFIAKYKEATYSLVFKEFDSPPSSQHVDQAVKEFKNSKKYKHYELLRANVEVRKVIE